jgi:hypothetical protein
MPSKAQQRADVTPERQSRTATTAPQRDYDARFPKEGCAFFGGPLLWFGAMLTRWLIGGDPAVTATAIVGASLLIALGCFCLLEPAQRAAQRDAAFLSRMKKRYGFTPQGSVAAHIRSQRRTGVVIASIGATLLLIALA